MRSLIAALACVSLLLLPAASVAEEGPDLSGTWRLDPDRSQTLREVMRDVLLQNDDNPRARQRWARAEGREREMLRRSPFVRLVVAQRDELIEIRYDDGYSREIHTDGRELGPVERYGIKGGRARWEDGRLIVENETVRRGRTEHWELVEDGKRLIITTYVDAGEPHGTVSFLRIYDLEPDATPADSDVEAESSDGDDDDDDG